LGRKDNMETKPEQISEGELNGDHFTPVVSRVLSPFSSRKFNFKAVYHQGPVNILSIMMLMTTWMLWRETTGMMQLKRLY